MLSFLVSVLFLVMGYFFVFVAAWFAYGVFRLVRANEQSRHYLEAGRSEEPLATDHLSEPLRRLALETRLLRVSLEGPARDIGQFVARDLHYSAEDLDAFDNMLMNMTRQLADWVLTVERLPPADHARLEDCGVNTAAILHAFDAEGWSFERKNLTPSGQPNMEARVRGIIGELARIESALQLAPSPYR